MKFAYKVIKTKNRKTTKRNEVVTEINSEILASGTVSFILVAKAVLGFRECASIVNIAKKTDSVVHIASGKKSGSSESIISLASLGIMAGKSFVLTIKGEHTEEAFHDIVKIINGESAA